ncbi:tRNA pseudouridine(38-40) synthase TruA [Methanocella sp. MCL-LM]|uniref:tRNA pseudouridine(38-40) synthase TruA n=1 Tax=Methanocella sp. MCL-LM TaxID=3412035 RepID=UPI003C734B0C
MKTALKIAYIGTNFYGSQAQPNLPTVESELRKALEEVGAIKPKTKIAMAGRTDAGVHALGQVVAFEAADPKLTAPRIINSKLPKDLWAYARADAGDDFDPRRHATSREYRYVMYAPDVIERRMKEFSAKFLGTHDFTNFSSIEPGKYPVRTVTKLDITRRGDFYVIDIEADSFLWNMVRKIVTALRLVGENKRPNDWIEKMFDPTYTEGIPPASPAGLYLSKVNYEGIAFEEDEYARQRAYQRMLNARSSGTTRLLKCIKSLRMR